MRSSRIGSALGLIRQRRPRAHSVAPLKARGLFRFRDPRSLAVDGSSEGRPFQTVLPKCVNEVEAPLSAKCSSMFAGSTAQIPSFSVLPSGQFCAGAGGDSPLQHQPSTHSLPGVDASSRQELRTNVLHVAEEPHFIIATCLVACRKMFRGPSVPFGNDDLPGGIVMAVCHRFCSASSAHARPLNLNRSRIGACGCGPAPSASSRWAGKVGGLSRTRRSVAAHSRNGICIFK